MFISYSHKDANYANKIFSELKGAKFKVWIDKFEIKHGDDFAVSILNGIKTAKSVLCLISNHYIKSESCLKELKLAHFFKRKIYLVMIENIKLEETAIGFETFGIQRCNLYKKSNNIFKSFTASEQFERLVEEIGKYIAVHQNEAETKLLTHACSHLDI